MSLMADVESDKQRGDLLEDARILQLPPIDGAHSGKLRGERSRELTGVSVIAADDHVAVERFISVQKFSG